MLTTKKNFIWNSVGSIFNALSSVIMLTVVSQSMGTYEAGIFSLAWFICQTMYTVGSYGMRNYQSTDIHNKFNFNLYFSSRILTSILMMFFSAAYIIIKGYDIYKSSIIIMMCGYKLIEAIADVIHGELQKRDRLDLAGKSIFYKTFYSTIGFSLMIIITKKLIIASLTAFLISSLIYYIFDKKNLKKFVKERFKFERYNLIILLETCFPLFLSSFLQLYLINCQKYIIDEFMQIEYQAYYAMIFMPASIFNIISGFIFRPIMVKLAHYWDNKQYRKLTNIVIFIILANVIVLLITEVGAYLLGIPVLSKLYNTNLKDFKIELLIILFGGSMNAINVFLQIVITFIREQKYLLIAYGISCIFTTAISIYSIKNWGFMGAAFSYSLTMTLLTIILAIIVFIKFKNKNTKVSDNAKYIDKKILT